MYDPANLTDLRGDGLDGDGHADGREEFAEDMLGFSPFKKLKKAVKKVSSLPSRITKPIARVVGKVPVIGRPAASGLRAAAQLANPLAVLRPKSFVKTQARALTSPLSAVRSLVKKPAPRKPPIAQRARPSWSKPLPAKPVARPAPRIVARPVARPAPKPVARPVARPAPKPVARPVPRPAPRAPMVAAAAPRPQPSWMPPAKPAVARPAATPPPSFLPSPPAAPEPLEPTFEQPFEEESTEEQPFEEESTEEQSFEEEASEEQPFEEESTEEQPFEEESTEEAPAGWEEET
ncbi:MAG: hypothetical protein WC565_06725 [Parcubacteria group bacterium]